ncbi:MAG: selenide, water dikinase SelD [Candidatus Wallbacteria bacterium HGW-Wallbacteria-1]|jgi:selenide,water dikinase|uniref:Selenide, water dikinase SelD n=1 Tax=Candidatus Wallbacteria bacterium HGW-Wallbacteria-1 TaxID=2013854 RepID=A0A2N1PVF8_9BACT|nr:MAG: selenide, water dikinase SelD [Candidatus Wallbacteria bacterium HGW-Wallbacteria-1]
MRPDALAQVLRQLQATIGDSDDPAILSGLAEGDDAAVVEVPSGGKIILTLDFFPPIVDDPCTFGKIAAANALSDVFAMGGTPVAALNICCFPPCLDTDIIASIIRGGAEKVKESGGMLVGGHTIEDDVPKYGLSVMGFSADGKIWEKKGASAGDAVILTKPLGTGIITTASKAGLVDALTFQLACESMAMLNKRAMETLRPFEPSACTDVTGFGLVGHALEICSRSSVAMEIDFKTLPFIGTAPNLAEEWLFPAGTNSNRHTYEKSVNFSPKIEEHMIALCNTPETSGGLLACVSSSCSAALLEEFRIQGIPAWQIGKVISGVPFLFFI